MYCPNCATANAEQVKFCRSCGANLSLVPQAMTGKFPEVRDTERRGRHRNRHGRDEDKPPNLAKGITQLITGVGFLVAALAIFFSPGGRGWWWAMLFPAFSLIGKGVADIVTVRTTMNLSRGT
ncbi:MAG TPA: zinc ribbon domain-containing protein, partial [Blastocatellia bacterium]|nr:zinc ribbon domain-containing protein [Blastocatellia bacterium]